MKSNPGGRIAPDEALGREELVHQIWTILESQSIYMNAERRIGKTTVLEILNSKPQRPWIPAKKDLEACHTAQEFSAVVYEQVKQFFTLTKRTFRNVTEFLTKLGGVEVGGLKLPEGKDKHWKTLLEKTFQDLHESYDGNEPRILFLWDEVPFMIDNIRKRQGEETAMEVLDTLRFLRQTYPTIRMVMTGSIGLHHVLSSLKKAGYANAPVNDMAAVEVPVFAPEKGAELARLLLEGEKIPCDSIEVTSQYLAKAVDWLPYFIHHLVRQLKFQGQKATPQAITDIIEEQLGSPNDPWELKHYRTRISTYYGDDEKAVLAILDVVAREKDPVALDQIAQKISSTVPHLETERLRSILTLLERDHYLRKKATRYFFTFPLVRQWWRLDRSIR